MLDRFEKIIDDYSFSENIELMLLMLPLGVLVLLVAPEAIIKRLGPLLEDLRVL